ncbi:sensor histidine kinase [Nocardia suismassiliense]|uniref:sensor histidine kinase n=1 Tax=Nocardia suismassiliense TaxID=2077092 RepID=UPI000D1D7FFE|nr:ATP-binding protein [Nocardia suismassiliense]
MIETAAPRRSAEARLVRGASLFVGSGGIFYAALTMPTALAQSALAAPWWTPFALTAIYLPTVGIVVAAARWRFDLVRYAVLTFALGYLLAAIAWLVVRADALVPAEKSLWITWIPGLPALALCIFWRLMPFGYLAVAATLAQIAAAYARGPDAGNPIVPEMLFAVAYSALPCAACVVLVRVGRTLDRTSHAVRAKATATAAAEARRFERRRFDALAHDWVIATLLEASRAPNSTVLTHHADMTLRDLERLRTGRPEPDTVDLDQVVAGIRATAAEVDDSVRLHADRPASGTLAVPSDVATALAAAVGEALRNWQRHAGSRTHAADCAVRVTADATSVRVDVMDDGVGFDPATVPPDRIGLRASITDRLAELPGGWSAIDAAPGRGCHVSAGWVAR